MRYQVFDPPRQEGAAPPAHGYGGGSKYLLSADDAYGNKYTRRK